ncbi:hypothetical protein HK405_012642, partial [Cladochytrium tenue]
MHDGAAGALPTPPPSHCHDRHRRRSPPGRLGDRYHSSVVPPTFDDGATNIVNMLSPLAQSWAPGARNSHFWITNDDDNDDDSASLDEEDEEDEEEDEEDEDEEEQEDDDNDHYHRTPGGGGGNDDDEYDSMDSACASTARCASVASPVFAPRSGRHRLGDRLGVIPGSTLSRRAVASDGDKSVFDQHALNMNRGIRVPTTTSPAFEAAATTQSSRMHSRATAATKYTAGQAGGRAAFRCLKTIEPSPRRAITCICVGADGHVYVGARDGGVGAIDGSAPGDFRPPHARGVTALCALAGGALLASGSEDGTVAVWDARTGRRTRSLRAHAGCVAAVCAAVADGSVDADGVPSPAPAHVFSGGADGAVSEWDARTGRRLWILAGHSGGVLALAAGPARVSSAARDGSVRVWDTRSGRCVAVLDGPSAGGWVAALAVSSDGARLFGGARDGTVRAWDLSDGGRCLHTVNVTQQHHLHEHRHRHHHSHRNRYGHDHQRRQLQLPGQEHHPPPPHKDAINDGEVQGLALRALCWSSGALFTAAGCSVIRWEDELARSHDTGQALKGHRVGITAVCADASGSVYTASADGT